MVLCRDLQNYIVVDILGLSIPGVLPYSEWIHGYAANIKEQAVSGKIIDVKIKVKVRYVLPFLVSLSSPTYMNFPLPRITRISSGFKCMLLFSMHWPLTYIF